MEQPCGNTWMSIRSGGCNLEDPDDEGRGQEAGSDETRIYPKHVMLENETLISISLVHE